MKCRALAALLFLACGAHAQDSAFDQSRSRVSLNDTARFLAGLPVNPESSLVYIQDSPLGLSHVDELAAAFDHVEQLRLKPMRTWAKLEIQPRIPRPETMFYLFGGPDFLSVASIFPEAQTYILAGLEPVGQVPDLLAMEPHDLAESLPSLRYSLRSVLEKGFFETREMREDLHRGSVHGVLPLLYIFLARTGHVVTDATSVSLDAGGMAQADPTRAEGIRIGFTNLQGGPRQILYYFSTDVSDGALARDDRFIRFLSQQGSAGSYLKAASYLMHGAGFDRIRNVLLDRSSYILQDDSGIPLRYLQTGAWELQFFGRYAGPVDIFSQYEQVEMWDAFSDPDRVAPLPFATGYRRDDREAHQVFAIRRVNPVLE